MCTPISLKANQGQLIIKKNYERIKYIATATISCPKKAKDVALTIINNFLGFTKNEQLQREIQDLRSQYQALNDQMQTLSTKTQQEIQKLNSKIIAQANQIQSLNEEILQLKMNKHRTIF